MVSYRARGSARRSAAEPGLVCWSGGGFESDFVAEGFELADVGALLAVGVVRWSQYPAPRSVVAASGQNTGAR